MGQGGDFGFGVIAADFDVDDDARCGSGGQPGQNAGGDFGERVGVDRARGEWGDDCGFCADQVAGKFEIDGKGLLAGAAEDAGDVGGGAGWVIEDGVVAGDFAEDAGLGVHFSGLVVKHPAGFAFVDAGCAGDDDDGDAFGVCAGDAVSEVEGASTPGDDGRRYAAMEASGGVGGEAHGGFVAESVDGEDGCFFDDFEER